MHIQDLEIQREILDAQIEEVKTKDVRASIAELEANYDRLMAKLKDAKARKKVNDVRIGEQIAELRAEIKKLTDSLFAQSYAIMEIERQLVNNGARLEKEQNRLKSLLSKG